jgi:hypothetical protein
MTMFDLCGSPNGCERGHGQGDGGQKDGRQDALLVLFGDGMRQHLARCLSEHRMTGLRQSLNLSGDFLESSAKATERLIMKRPTAQADSPRPWHFPPAHRA